ncbi:uncharacterized protein LOC131635778 [Vicia villosa]|uniref:uncharacterized protein LOC131635778 n=1 Tax=Vicia villosa TaxID=3911 RepID=UPI00273C3051|nr:uncharacterized protein LOC131635778 [Vicia villosa]
MTRGRGRVRWEEVPGGSTSAPRSRLSQASSSRAHEQIPDEDEVPELVEVPEKEVQDSPAARLHAAMQHANLGYLGGPSNISLLIYYNDHAAMHVWDREERLPIKSLNQSRKIFDLFKPRASWFNDVVVGFELGGLFCIGYVTISHDMQGAFAERWHKGHHISTFLLRS